MEQRGSGDERLAAICQTIRNETLEPAQRDAESIRQGAEREAAKIRAEARQQADLLLHETRKKLIEEKQAFEASLQQACKQTTDLLRQRIEKSLFRPMLDEWLEKEFASEEKTALLINVLIEYIKKQGFEGDLSCWIGSHLDKEKVVKHLATASIKVRTWRRIFPGRSGRRRGSVQPSRRPRPQSLVPARCPAALCLPPPPGFSPRPGPTTRCSGAAAHHAPPAFGHDEVAGVLVQLGQPAEQHQPRPVGDQLVDRGHIAHACGSNHAGSIRAGLCRIDCILRMRMAFSPHFIAGDLVIGDLVIFLFWHSPL